MKQEQMSENTESVKTEVVGYQFTLTTTVVEGTQLSITGNFLKGAPKSDMDAELDKLMEVADRQAAVMSVPGIVRRVQEIKETIVRTEEAVASLGTLPPSNRNKQELEKAIGSLENQKVQLKNWEAVLEAATQKVGKPIEA